MPTTFDISEGPDPSNSQFRMVPDAGGGRGTGTQLDDIARTIFYLSLAAFVLFLGYLFWGLFGGSWSTPVFTQMSHPDRQRQLSNITLIFSLLRVSVIIGVISILITCLRDEMIGYIFVAVGAVFYLGLPFATTQINDARSMGPTAATQLALQDLQSLWPIFVIPGALWVLADIVRRFQALSENTAVQRANVKYGSDVARQSNKQKQRFLGRCWETAFCRDHVREKCPIYIKRRGPCWWYKQGCMCEESIVLQAVISSDWKQKTKQADQSLSLGAAAGMPKTILSPAAKRDRCRKCIIYNEHQRDKYKLESALTVLVVPALILLNINTLRSWIGAVLAIVDHATSRFSLSSAHDGSTLSATATSGLISVLVVCLGLVILSQALKLVEYFCFKLKI